MASQKLALLKEKSAFVLGYTGEVGKELTRELQEKKIFKKVYLLGRRKVEYNNPIYENAEQVIVNFDEIDKEKQKFEGCEYGFCCLGTTKGKSGKDGFYKVDHDYIVNSAKVAHEAGCRHFTLVSTVAADKNSWFFMLKTKGLTEEHVNEIPFERTSILRPGNLLCDRQEVRIFERIGYALMKPLTWARPTYISIPTVKVGKAMIYNVLKDPETQKEVLTNAKQHELADELDKLFADKDKRIN